MALFFAYFAAFFPIGLASWIHGTFGYPTIDQILYHLHFSDEAAVKMSGLFAFTFVIEALTVPLLSAAVAAWVHRAAARKWPGWPRQVLRTLPHAGMIASTTALLLQFSVFSYAAAHFQPDRFAEAYVAPQAAQGEAAKPRNLILIYVESLEGTYADAEIFGTDLLAPLRSVGGSSFAGYRQADGANWTIAAMVATQCGVPLRVHSDFNLRSDVGRVFLPGAVCLGDLLRTHGYRNVFLGGASLSFAGKGAFLRDHGYDEIWGREEWRKAGTAPEELGWWGLHDDALLARARAQLDALHAAGQPFNLTLLTLDTHGPDGFLSPTCRRRGVDNFAGILTCTSEQLAGFVQYVRDRGYLEDTTLVILGDHLAGGTPLDAKLRKSTNRRMFNLLLAHPQPTLNTRELLPFDMFPTLAELAGLRVPGGRLGLGVSGLGEPDTGDGPPRLDEAALRALVGSGAYARLWQRQGP